jgi:hypothetical protein
MLRRQGYFTPFIDVHLWLGEQVSGTIVLNDPAPGEGTYGFWEAIFVTAHSLLQVHHHGSFTSSSDARQGSSPSTGLQNHCPQWSCSGRGWIRFLVSDLCDCSLASSSSSSRLIYLFVGRASRVIAFNANSVGHNIIFTLSSLSRNHKSRTISPLKSCLTYWICSSM